MYISDTGETVPPATGKWKYLKEFDSVVFKMSRPIAECTDLNRKIFEPAFEAVMDAGKISINDTEFKCF